MAVIDQLARGLVHGNPEVLAGARASLPDLSSYLARFDQNALVDILPRIEPALACSVLMGIAPEQGGYLVKAWEAPVASSILVRLPESVREPLLAKLPPAKAADIRARMRYLPGSAGSLMDADVPAFRKTMSVQSCIDHLSQIKIPMTHIYVMDHQGKLVGMGLLTDLLAARSSSVTLGDWAEMPPSPVRVDTSGEELLNHPSWEACPMLPVVDYNGNYLGTLSYSKLIRKTLTKGGERVELVRAGAALGELYALGLKGLFSSGSNLTSEGGG